MPRHHVQRLFLSIEGVQAAGRDPPAHAGPKREDAFRRTALAASAQDDADPLRGVRVRRLICMGRNMQMVQTRLPHPGRTDQERVRTAIDILQAALRLQRSADLPEPPIAWTRDHQSTPTLALHHTLRGTDEEHPGLKPKSAMPI